MCSLVSEVVSHQRRERREGCRLKYTTLLRVTERGFRLQFLIERYMHVFPGDILQ